MISKKDASVKSGKAQGIKQKPMRSYIKTATKAATHPVRSSILKSLKNSAKSTVELEEITGEARYNLYHHLNLLEDVDLVEWKLKDNKTKMYSLKKPSRPQAAVLIFDEDDIKEKLAEFQNFINALIKMEGQEIPHKNKIIKAEICLYFPWS
jgi:DUF438 domain-containing protein